MTEDPDVLARRSAQTMWSTDAASRMLGMEIEAVGPGTASVSMTVRADMINGWQLCHGGLIASLADSAFAVACNSRGTVTVASGFDVTFLEPARLGDLLVAMATERARRGRSGVYDRDPRHRRDRHRGVPRPQPIHHPHDRRAGSLSGRPVPRRPDPRRQARLLRSSLVLRGGTTLRVSSPSRTAVG